MNKWEKAKTIVFMFSSVAAAIAAWMIPFKVEKAIGEKDIQARLVATAVDILTRPPSRETTNLRDWAVDVINVNSSVKLNKKTKEDLVKNIGMVDSSTSFFISVFDIDLVPIKNYSANILKKRNDTYVSIGATASGDTSEFSFPGKLTDTIVIRVRKKGYRDFEQELKDVGPSNYINAILRAEK
jgi:hypothetical protein